jgi:hypothetical protein
VLPAGVAVDLDRQLRGLPRLPQQGDLVDGDRLRLAAVDRRRGHAQRVQGDAHRLLQALDQPVLAILVEQEADAAAIHAEDRHVAAHHVVQGLQHEAVAAQHDDDIGLAGRRTLVALAQPRERRLGDIAFGGEKGDPGRRGVVAGHRVGRSDEGRGV